MALYNENYTGFKLSKQDNIINVYPNPTKSTLNIDCTDKFNKIQGHTITIMNCLGQPVYTSVINRQLTSIDLKSFSGEGIYYLHLIDTNNNIIYISKIILL
jgi:hypothetical protein